jgi:hypothetical protein
VSAGLAFAYYTPNGTYVIDHNAHLAERIGIDPNSVWYPISTPAEVAQVSAGTLGHQDAVFARLVNGDVYEYYGTPGNFKQAFICHNAAEISGSVRGLFSTVFVRKTDNSVSQYDLFWGVSATPLGAPAGINPKSATQISAGLDGATGNPAVFVNFQGALYEHTGYSPTAGWSYVTGCVITSGSPWWQQFLAVSDCSASQAKGDTVFAVNGPFGSLTEYVGFATTTGLQYTAYSLGTGAAQVSAGVDQYGNALAFVLKTNGELWGHSGLDSSNGWFWVDSGVTALAASQGQAYWVVYETTPAWSNWGCYDAVVQSDGNFWNLVSGWSFNL